MSESRPGREQKGVAVPFRLEAAPPRSRTAYPREAVDSDFLSAGMENPRLDSVRLLEYLRVLYKRRWTAIAAFVSVMAVTTVHTLSQVPEYEAKVRLLVEPERRVPGSRTLVDDEEAALIDFQTQHAIVNSHTFARKTMEALNIWEPAAYAAAHPPQQAAGVGAAMDYVFSRVRQWWSPQATPADPGDTPAVAPADTPQAQAARISAFLSGVQVSPVPRSRLIEITYTSTNPEHAANYANAIADRYIEQNLEFKSLANREASAWLSERLAEQRQRVEAAEAAVHEYRKRNQVVASTDERVKASIQRLAELATAVTRARTDRIEKETAYNRLRSVQNDRAALEGLPEVAGNPAVQELRAQLAAATRTRAQLGETLLERHPEVIKAQKVVEATQARLDTAVDNAVKVIRSEFEAARAAEASLVQVHEQQKREATQMNQTDVQFAVLQRDAESNRQIYEAMLQRAREGDVAGEPKSTNVRILDPATLPRTPSSGTRASDLRLGALAGLTLAVVLVWFFEYIDNRVKSPSDVEQYLGLPFLGLVPTMDDRTTPQLLVNDDVPFHFGEAFRGIRTNVLFSTAAEGTRSVVITSANPGEGKTVVSSNLAVSLALAGQRVLLIDGDLRRPRVHTMFDMMQEPGLTNLLVGNVPATEVIRRTVLPGLLVMPAGHVPPNPAELLGSKRFVNFLARLHTHFDWVIIDSPPAIAVTDPCVLSHIATATILVVSAERTSRYGARDAVDRLQTAGGHVLGVVLNNVDLKDNAYYYARQYKAYYSAYEQGDKAQAG